MSRAAIIKDSEVVQSLRKEIAWLRSLIEERTVKHGIRSVREVAQVLKSHAKSGKGLVLSRDVYVAPDEILALLQCLGYAERED